MLPCSPFALFRSKCSVAPSRPRLQAARATGRLPHGRALAPRHCYKPPRLRARQLRHVALGAGFLQVGVPVTSLIISIWVLGRSDKKGRGRRAPSSCCEPSRTPPWAAAATGSPLLVTHGSCDMAQRLLRDLAAEHLQSTQQGGEQKPGRARAPLPAPGDQQLLPEAGAEASPSEQGFKG